MKTVLITGANRGLGLEWVKQYLADGNQVVATCRVPSKAEALGELKASYGEELLLCPLEVDSPESIQRASEWIAENGLSLDILINNAGVGGDLFSGGPDWETMESIYKVNTVSPLMVTRAFYPFLRKGSGSIVAQMSSLLGSIGHKPNLPKGGYAYSCSKAALNMVTQLMSLEYAKDKVIVLALSPGWVRTDMGGEEAPLTASESIEGLRSVLGSASFSQTGSYWHYDGTELPW